MKKLQLVLPVDEVQASLEKLPYDSFYFDKKILDELGFYVLRQAFSKSLIASILEVYNSRADLTPLQFHPTRVDFESSELTNYIFDNSAFLQILKSDFFEGNVAAQKPIFFRKDEQNADRVILHNDIDYMHGKSEKYSIFIACTCAHSENGALELFPGTHNFGSLGDAGEIDDTILPKSFPTVCPTLEVGDCLIMNSSIWHRSGVSHSSEARVLLEIKIHDANDPFLGKVILGERSSKWAIIGDPQNVFLSSRTQKLRAMYEKFEG